VEQHGGALTVSSEPGRGSTFVFTLPLASSMADLAQATVAQWVIAGEAVAASSAAASSAVTSPPAATDPGRLAVLAVDDDPVNLSILQDLLDPPLYEVVAATSGADALQLLDQRQWNLVVADAMMPSMSGYELTRRIRERFSVTELPILMVTARTQPDDLDAAFRAGANDFLSKPFDALELRARVSALAHLTEAARQQLRLETAVLQAQIQPHFLFNTLNSIAALSEVDPERMRVLLNVFGDYLRASFDFRNLARLVPLQHELELVRSYVYIQTERFGDRLSVQWQVDEQLTPHDSVLIPPLTIQPLVENAVTHGALAHRQGGQVLIRLLRSDGHLLVEIGDNGPGLDTHAWLTSLEQEPRPGQGIGMRHTDRRLRQMFGVGLRVESTPGQGTMVSFIVPMP
jgi:sensor histidine kinase YesM